MKAQLETAKAHIDEAMIALGKLPWYRLSPVHIRMMQDWQITLSKIVDDIETFGPDFIDINEE